MDEYSKLEHIWISNPRAWQSEILLGLSVLHENLNLSNIWYDNGTLSTLAEKSKLLNKYQILLREFDENSWKLDVNIRLPGHLQSQTKIVRTL